MQVYKIPLDANHMETTQHGSPRFPLAVYTTEIRKNILGYIDWHWHQELQFCVVTKGEVCFFVNQTQILLKAGDGIFINTGQLHKAIDHADSDGTYICLDFHPDLISGFSGSIMQTKYVLPYLKDRNFSYCVLRRDVLWQSEMLDLILAVSQEFHRENADEMQIFIWLTMLWHTFVTSGFTQNKTCDTSVGPQVRIMLEYIRANYTGAITLDAIAKEASLAKSTCCREFKKQMGCTIFEHILNLRLQKASHLLLSSQANITEISLLCGFANSSYFTREFREKTGLSPSAYRKEKRTSSAEILSTM